MLIPCETIVRLSALLGEAPFNALRLDNGRVIATDRKFAVVERVAPFDGVAHVLLTDALVEQCRLETQFSSSLTVTPNDALGWTTAVTTMAWQSAENLFAPSDPLFDAWYDKIVTPCLGEPTSNGALTAYADQLARLARSAPSGSVTFEPVVDIRRPIVVRDIHSPDWVGFFMPRLDSGEGLWTGATVPNWLREA